LEKPLPQKNTGTVTPFFAFYAFFAASSGFGFVRFRSVCYSPGGDAIFHQILNYAVSFHLSSSQLISHKKHYFFSARHEHRQAEA
jgi:hypothetical protein